MRGKSYKDLGDLKRMLQQEWEQITIEEVRARIAELPTRCKQLAKRIEQPLIKSDLW